MHTFYVLITGGGFTSSRGTFGNIAKNCDMLCLAFGKTEDVTYSGGSDGNVFIWAGTNLKKAVKAHEGPLFAMHSLDKVCKLLVKTVNTKKGYRGGTIHKISLYVSVLYAFMHISLNELVNLKTNTLRSIDLVHDMLFLCITGIRDWR